MIRMSESFKPMRLHSELHRKIRRCAFVLEVPMTQFVAIAVAHWIKTHPEEAEQAGVGSPIESEQIEEQG